VIFINIIIWDKQNYSSDSHVNRIIMLIFP